MSCSLIGWSEGFMLLRLLEECLREKYRELGVWRFIKRWWESYVFFFSMEVIFEKENTHTRQIIPINCKAMLCYVNSTYEEEMISSTSYKYIFNL